MTVPPPVTPATFGDARAYEYFKRRFIENVPSCDSQRDFVGALQSLGVSCAEIKEKTPAEAFKLVRTIVNGQAISATMRKIRLALFNEAID